MILRFLASALEYKPIDWEGVLAERVAVPQNPEHRETKGERGEEELTRSQTPPRPLASLKHWSLEMLSQWQCMYA